MNQHVRMSEFLVRDAVQRPSSKYQVRFAEARPFACRYILGEPNADAICCGAPTDGKSWCEYHRGVVFDVIKSGSSR